MLPTLALAPMQGVLNDILRDIYVGVGGMDYCVTEFIRVSQHALSEGTLLRDCPELARGAVAGASTPVHVQLLGGQPEPVAQTAQLAAKLGARVIDLNFGCPVRRVNSNDGGAALLRSPARMTQILRAVRDAVPTDVSVSAKIRLGWADPGEVEGLCEAVQAGGASWVTVHGRTRVQAYGGVADWDAIARARRAIGIPVVANGDIVTPDDLAKCHTVTGCDRFMIGRGALRRPEVFLVLRGASEWWPGWRRLELARSLLDKCHARSPQHEGFALGRVKGWLALMAQDDSVVEAAFIALKRVSEVSEAARVLESAIARGQAD